MDWRESFFEGEWTLSRQVSGEGNMVGVATFVARRDGRLAYSERGTATLNHSGQFEFYRTYLYKIRPDGFDVYFDEQPERLFHSIDLDGGSERLEGHAEHVCGQDLYESHYEISDDATFAVRHLVIGPRKNYMIETNFRREPHL